VGDSEKNTERGLQFGDFMAPPVYKKNTAQLVRLYENEQ
jgi:hypothetical protein